MTALDNILQHNVSWAANIKKGDPGFFERLAAQQAPRYLWIGCADSRVPANQILGLDPGEVFVHRNVANLVVNTDFNCLSVVQFAVEVLKVTDVIVCGHYGCGGVQAALAGERFGLIDNWLRHIKDTACRHESELQHLEGQERANRMCELNVKQQVANLCHTTILQGAWSKGQDLTVHGLIYSLKDGLLKNLEMDASSPDQLPELYRMKY